MAFSPDGELLALAQGTAVRVVRTRDWTTAAVLRGHLDAVRSVALSRDGRLIVTASDDGTTRVWHAETQASVASVSTRRTPLVSALVARETLVTAAADGVVRLYECEPCLPVKELARRAGWRVRHALTQRELRQAHEAR